MKQKGIVLRLFMPTKHKAFILDYERGKIEVLPRQSKHWSYFQHGALLSYELNDNYLGNAYILEQPELMAIPFQLAQADIMFFHHILELYYYFLPVNAQSPMIFDLLYTILFKYPTPNNKQKLLFITLFFIYNGIYDQQAPVSVEFTKPLQSFIPLYKQFIMVKDSVIKSWLNKCFNLHPQKHQFKTMIYYNLP